MRNCLELLNLEFSLVESDSMDYWIGKYQRGTEQNVIVGDE